jgi:DNA primase
MSIPLSFKQELRQRLPLSAWIGKKVKVTRAGPEFKACCPFHHEKTPSFTINDQKQFYHCFGCGAHGDIITFAMEINNLPFMEAIEMLAAEAGLQVPQQTPEQKQAYEAYDRTMACLAEASKFFRTCLHEPKFKDIKKYALGRGLNEETLEQFRLGFAPADRMVLPAHLKAKGFSEKEMIEASLCRASKKGDGVYAFFRDRLMFPVTDGRGRVVAFGGRILPDHLKQPEQGDFTPPKYINSSDTLVFHKGRMVFNESIARTASGKENAPIIITEGYMDVIALVQNGFHGAVAPLGTALTEDQINLCWSMIAQDVKEFYVCFDGDNAGKRAAERSVERMLPLLQPSMSARFVFMPAGEDPDSLIKSGGKSAFQRYLDRAEPMINVIWASLTEGYAFDTPERIAGLEKSVENLVSKISHASVAHHYKTHLRDKIRENYSPYALKQAKYKAKTAPLIALTKPGQQSTQSRIQATLLYALYLYPQYISRFEEMLAMINFDEPQYQAMCDALLEAYVASEEALNHQRLKEIFLDFEQSDLYLHYVKDVARLDGGFLIDMEKSETIVTGINQLLQNIVQRGSFDPSAGAESTDSSVVKSGRRRRSETAQRLLADGNK